MNGRGVATLLWCYTGGMYSRARFLLLAVSATVFIVGGTSLTLAALPRPMSRLAPPMPPRQIKSPGELQAEKDALLARAIEKRRSRGLAVDEENVRLAALYTSEFEGPTRSYAQQACYHQTNNTDPDSFAYCDAGRCVFSDVESGYPDGGYCELATRDCYDRDGVLILNENGVSVTDSRNAVFVKYDMCLNADGSLVTPSGEKTFDEKIRTGCGYRVGKKVGKYLEGMIGYMMTCDAYRCVFHPGSGVYYDREAQIFHESGTESKTPPYEYVPYLDWKCLDTRAVTRISTKYRCSIVAEEDENWGCTVCFENGKHVYRNCKNYYDERGRIAGARVTILPETESALDDLIQYGYALHERGRQDLRRPADDILLYVHQTPLSDAAQKKIVSLIEDFIARYDAGQWNDGRLGKELARLHSNVRHIKNKF